MEQKTVITGTAIIVCDRGFVYVGNIVYDDKFCIVKKAHNIRRWGTTKGLGQLALNGPTDDTILDQVGTISIPVRAVINIIDTEATKWTCLK